MRPPVSNRRVRMGRGQNRSERSGRCSAGCSPDRLQSLSFPCRNNECRPPFSCHPYTTSYYARRQPSRRSQTWTRRSGATDVRKNRSKKRPGRPAHRLDPLKDIPELHGPEAECLLRVHVQHRHLFQQRHIRAYTNHRAERALPVQTKRASAQTRRRDVELMRILRLALPGARTNTATTAASRAAGARSALRSKRRVNSSTRKPTRGQWRRSPQSEGPSTKRETIDKTRARRLL